MLFWLLAFAVTAIACAALYFAAAGKGVNAPAAAGEETVLSHFRMQLREIEADAAQGRLGESEALAAKKELARELLRAKAEAQSAAGSDRPKHALTTGAVLSTAAIAFLTYGFLGHPDLPAAPLVARADIPTQLTMDQAMARIEAQLKANPDDVRGWTVVAPAYMQMGRYADAETAFRQVIALSGDTPDRDTDLGEAIMMQKDGNAEGEPLELFRKAAAADPKHVRSRYYIAGELTRAGDFTAAVAAWQELLALGEGSEAWVTTAKQGLAAAEAGLGGGAAPDTQQIEAMVDGLSARLASDGGSIAEWTQLVRSRLVQGKVDDAQQAYEAARAAYPDATVRTELDVLAADNGLVAKK